MINPLDTQVRKYKNIRTMGMALMSKVSKTVPVDILLQAAREFRMRGKDGKTVILDEQSEADFIMDRAIHDIPWPKTRWIEQICSQNSADYSPQEHAMLKAHSQAYFSLYEISAIEAGCGLRLRDLFNNQELLLMDIGLAATVPKGGLLATRIVTLEDIHFTSGVGMPFPVNAMPKLTANFYMLYAKKKKVMSWEQMMRRYAPYFFIEYKKGPQKIMFSHLSADE